ncbi:MAG: hypothetical protein IRY99_01145 [Isosphaeraceae bacterium]|nr:hypothetical protein [Isosphaeraceae bacterium]
MLNVFITVDTEAWPFSPGWRESGLAQDIDRDIYGITPGGEFGIAFQMDVLDAYGLKAVFLVEPLFACVVGLEPLRQIVALIQGRGHEVQLHLHTEWLAWMDPSILPGRTGQNIGDFFEDEQAQLIAQGLQNLQACGAHNLVAFRAGNYGANFDTLRALARNGLLYDTSHNTNYLGSACDMRTPDLLLQPRRMHGVIEFPISIFRDRPGHYRHSQLCACSGAELEDALLGAWRRGWYAFVLVSHSFELIKRRRGSGRPPAADGIVIRRFERLCRFLASHRDKFRTAVFAEIDPEAVPEMAPQHPPRTGLHRTAWRFAEQLARRVYP